MSARHATTLIPLALLLAACSPSPTSLHATPVDQLHANRVPLDKEWRDALRVPATESPAIDLGPIPDEAQLRFGVLPNGLSTAKTSRVHVYAGDRRVHAAEISRGDQWHDFRVDLADYVGKSCRIIIEDGQADWLSNAEFVTPESQHHPNVLLFLIDTLRNDHLSAYGYHRDTSPNIDALARDAVLFENASSQTSWTRPAVASVLTGVYPHIHGANDWPDVLRDNLPRIGDALKSAGYESHAFFINPQVLPVWGFGDEFTRVVDVDAELGLVGEDKAVVDRVVPALRNVAGRPWFFFVHTLGPHEPYSPPAGYETKFAPEKYEGDAETIRRQKLIELYDAEIFYTDLQFGRIVAELKDLGLYDDTIIVVTSDHGEEFWEHGGELHGQSLYEEVLNVPLIIKFPRNQFAGQRRDAVVETIDIAPTILDISALPPEPRFQGRSLVEFLHDPELDDRTAYASLFYEDQSMRAVKRGNQKYIRDTVAGSETWFDLDADPNEKHPLTETTDLTLARYVDHIASRGGDGLHLLITCGDGEKHTVSGTISGTGIKSHDLRFADSKKDIEFDGSTLSFELVTVDGLDEAQRRDVWHNERAEQDHAHLRVELAPDPRLRINLNIDGRPAPVNLITAGKYASHVNLADAPLDLAPLFAAPDAYDPAKLPRKFHIYAWYIPDTTQLSQQDLPEETLTELKALGYLE